MLRGGAFDVALVLGVLIALGCKCAVGQLVAGRGHPGQVWPGLAGCAEAGGVLGGVLREVARDLLGGERPLGVVGSMAGADDTDVELLAPGQEPGGVVGVDWRGEVLHRGRGLVDQSRRTWSRRVVRVSRVRRVRRGGSGRGSG